MKRIEDIELMSTEELDIAANECPVEGPVDLMDRLADAIVVSELTKRHNTPFHPIYAITGAIAAAAASLAVIFTISRGPKDTYSDPKLAYAELEKTFEYISSKMNAGIEIACEAKPVIEKTNNVINKIK